MSVMAPEHAIPQAGTSAPEFARPHRFTLDEYYRLSELGFFGDRRVELLDGEIFDMASQKDSHTFCVTRASRWCNRVFDEARFWVRSQSTLRAGDSAPEPDLAVMDYPAAPSDGYASSDRAVLIIEVADSTLLADTTFKMSLYASVGVRDYWVVSIPDRLLIVHRQPIRAAATKHGYAYAQVRRYSPGEGIAPLAMPDAQVDPTTLLS